jgi:hypothetical protein
LAPKFIEVTHGGNKISITPSKTERLGIYWFSVFRKGNVGAEGYVDESIFRLTLIPAAKEKVARWVPPTVLAKKKAP